MAWLKTNPGGASQATVGGRETAQHRQPGLERPSSLIAAHKGTVRSLNALAITLTEDSAIAAAAMIGESRIPKNG